MSQPRFIDTVNSTAVKNCNTQCKRYLQGLQREIELYPPQQDELHQEHWISQMKSLCKTLMPDHILGKTAGRVLELLITNSKIPIKVLSTVCIYQVVMIPLKLTPFLLGIPTYKRKKTSFNAGYTYFFGC